MLNRQKKAVVSALNLPEDVFFGEMLLFFTGSPFGCGGKLQKHCSIYGHGVKTSGQNHEAHSYRKEFFYRILR